MKKIILATLIIVSCTIISYSQSGAKWVINGNVVNTGDFIGTTNNEPFIIKSNNIVGLRIKPNGDLIIKSLDLNSSAPSGLVLTDGQGIISRLDFTGSGSQFLSGNGTWQNMPKGNWLNTGNDVYWTAGNVGIGIAPSPIFKLDVLGDARISNNLVVGGGIIISQKVEATSSLKTDTIHSVTGETKFTSKVILKNQFQVDGTTLFNGTVQAGNLYVSGTTNFASIINAQQGFTFDGVNGVTGIINGNNQIMRFGNKTATPAAVGCAAPPTSPFTMFQFGGNLQIFDPATTTTGGTVMNLQTWSGGSSIDASTAGNTVGSNLLLNYFCGNDVGICSGQHGGNVGLCNTTGGGIVSMGKNVEIGMPTTNLATALNINLPAGINNSIVINNPALTTTNKIVFEVSNTGKTNIGTGRPLVGGLAAAAMLSVDGLILAKEVRVAISTTTHWADYVFDKNYKLMPLNDVESFIKKNNHLPDVPSAEDVVKEGISVNEISATLLKKIEELTLYTIDLKKQLEIQQKEINSLKK